MRLVIILWIGVRHFSNGDFSSDSFPSGNFPNVQFPKQQLPKSVLAAALGTQHVLAAALGPHCSLRRLRGPTLTFGMLSLGILHIWEVATWETVTWDVALGRMSLGKYLTPFKLSINLKNPVPDSQRYPFAQKYSYLCLKNCRFFKKKWRANLCSSDKEKS